ncbi:hypothetical protein [Pseudomonas canadensis]|uniref:hypothetical protein n=1 Tax=Pseudomonas canadensis TaxID=915099 RepID=UPI0030DD91B7
MANTVQAKFKGTKKNHTSQVDIKELPNKGDYLNMEGQEWEVTKKTFYYDSNDNVTGVEFDLA